MRFHVLGRNLQEFAHAAVGKNGLPCFRADGDAGRTVFQYPAQASFVLAQLAFQKLALGDVLINPHHDAFMARDMNTLPGNQRFEF